MRKIDKIVLHCSATREGQDIKASTIKKWHVEDNGWADVGYHLIIELDGNVERGRPIEKSGAHARGHNSTSIGICYVGGCDQHLQPKNTMRRAQELSLIRLVRHFLSEYPNAKVVGHNELDSGKDCPSFNVQKWLEENGFPHGDTTKN